MKKVVMGLFYLFFVIYTIIVFTPKKELYYYGERYIKDYKVFISNENLTDFGIGLKVSDGIFFYDGIKGGKIEEISLLITLFYNRAEIDNVTINEDLKDFIPGGIERVSAVHWFWLPHVVFLGGEGEFGTFTGRVDLFQRKIYILLSPSPDVVTKFRPQLRFLKKTKEGYVYDKSF